MAKRYSRQQFLSRLRGEIASGKPLVMASVSSGIVAKFVERGGVDIMGVYNTGYFRTHGWGSLASALPLGDANEMVLQAGQREILPQVKETPVIAGVNGVDPMRDMRAFLEVLGRAGFSGVHNFPTVAWFEGDFRKALEATGLGFQWEIDMLNLARGLDLLTIGYAFSEEDTERLMRQAAPDLFIFHAGITHSSLGRDSGKGSLEEMATRSLVHFDLARKIKPEVILLAHGAALVNPGDAQYLVDRTGCHGVQLGASIERTAIELPLQERAASFKKLSYPSP